ncbi:hypothetical protein SK571_13515 [Lentzea sp. BCCO 10_0798]|uniref:Uncharacterized protein n=1 Tax=Lentzea kristufekii TaxID=3095430 RepID=A0ABU4TQ38_9PSEU|nr:hypothetical protein [Lentzea sp. BCCO 10_0798]MDX8050404.1 hypothetical protein [Lentzea sp. BCCO 10_0798]
MFRVLTNCRIFAGGADLTGASNKVELSLDREEKDRTTFGSGGAKERTGGLFDSALSAAGFWEAGSPAQVDDNRWSRLGAHDAWTVTEHGALVGDVAYLTKALGSTYKLLGAVGEVAPWEAEAKGDWPTARGVIAHPPGTARTATGTGTALELGAVTADQHLYACLHVLSAAGTTPSITVEIESDDAEAMASPTTRLSFAAATATGAQEAGRAAGAVTDTWWRPKWTITGVGPSFLFVVSFGIK